MGNSSMSAFGVLLNYHLVSRNGGRLGAKWTEHQLRVIGQAAHADAARGMQRGCCCNQPERDDEDEADTADRAAFMLRSGSATFDHQGIEEPIGWPA